MDNKNLEPIALEYPFHRSGVVNDFLNATGLSKNFRVVIVQVEMLDELFIDTLEKQWPGQIQKKGGPKYGRRITKVGLEPLDEETAFYWKLRGHDKLRAAIDDYIAGRPFNKGVS